jgi:hypothetical protein
MAGTYIGTDTSGATGHDGNLPPATARVAPLGMTGAGIGNGTSEAAGHGRSPPLAMTGAMIP